MHAPRKTDIQLFSLFAGVFLVHQLTQWYGLHSRILDNYLDPFLAVPVMLGAAILIIRLIQPKAKLHWITVAVYTAGLIVFFESGWIEDTRLHYDPIDAILYVVGALVFYFTINRVDR
ncbi:hypothetical protein [Phaeocystidibacter luteus]|uniref:Magnesium citrate secondary transporter n=1 Tax=Phaeocystidibacter luteus TaxID=911197 RepID=A0A6N6RJ61_9FLAO|nr:hypothetical protein [Phaeocystidibacter luteus]KAB2810381.1 hypothetical protein F8C67_07275 [Phaeocystidibacter luteus]